MGTPLNGAHNNSIKIKITKVGNNSWFWIVKNDDMFVGSGIEKNKGKAQKKAIKSAKKFFNEEVYYEVWFSLDD